MARSTRTFKDKANYGKELEGMRAEFKALLAEIDALYAKLDADAGVTGTNFAATLPSAKIVA